MGTRLSILALVLLAACTPAQNNPEPRYPTAQWQQYSNVEEAGFNTGELEKARRHFESMDSAAVLVIQDGAIVAAWGNQGKHYEIASARKSFISALYGIYFHDGTLDPLSTLADHQISDVPEPGFPTLTEQERTAALIHLLKFRSGVYHATLNAPARAAERPPRGSHAPDTHWYYNNWEVNVLCSIIEQQTGANAFEEIRDRLAVPLEMEDFSLSDTAYHMVLDRSRHGNHNLKMSPRDMARFGLLYLRNGRWRGQQLVPESYVDESLTAYSETGRPGRGYGYLWWVFESDSELPMRFEARGAGGQVISVVPSEKLVFVHTVDMYKNVGSRKSARLLQAILAAKTGQPDPNPVLEEFPDPFLSMKTAAWDTLDRAHYVGSYCKPDGETVVTIEQQEESLVLRLPTEGGPGFGFRLIPKSKTQFWVQDRELDMVLEFSSSGAAEQLLLGEGGFKRPQTLKTFPDGEWVEGPVHRCPDK